MPGAACRHNLLYWRNREWLAFGPSASGHLDGARFKVVPRLGDWLASQGPSPLSEVERIGDAGRFGEELMLGLRLAEGVGAAWLEERLGRLDPRGERRRAIDAAIADGRLERTGDAVRLTPRGRLLADGLLAEMI
jgi:coproporphyrinogen III oxidase-like Fe-S oxidoreductase